MSIIDRILLEEKPSVGLESLHESGEMRRLLPEVDILWETEQSPLWHSEGSVGVHTMMVVDAVREKTSKLTVL